MLTVRHGLHTLQESEFEIQDADWAEDLITHVKVHPWHRYKGTKDESRQVYVEVGFQERDEGDHYNVIVDREEFVTGLLETFPELRRA